jgi:hypothetical protein
MGRGVCELVCLIVPLLEGDEDAKVVLAGRDLDGGTGELGRDLVEASSVKALLGAADVEGADGWVMRRLLSQV